VVIYHIPRSTDLNIKKLKTLATRLNKAYNKWQPYEEELKNQFHKAAKNFLQELAVQLGLVPKDYVIHICRGGVAVLGETILQTDHWMFQAGEPCSPGPDQYTLLVRTCNGPHDLTGGPNTWPTTDAIIRNLDHYKVDNDNS